MRSGIIPMLSGMSSVFSFHNSYSCSVVYSTKPPKHLKYFCAVHFNLPGAPVCLQLRA